MRKESSEERTVLRKPIRSGCSMVPGERLQLHDDRRVQGCEIDLVYLLVHSRLRLGHHASLVTGPQIGDVPHSLGVSLSEWHGHAPAQGLEDLVAGDERAGREAGR